MADRDQSLGTLGNLLIIGSSVAVIAAFGIGWLLAGVSLRPINRLRQTAQEIGEQRDFDRRVDYYGPNDEIGQLATTFNAMLAELLANEHRGRIVATVCVRYRRDLAYLSKHRQ